MIVFLCDETVCWFANLKPLMVTFLSIFTSITFVYLLVIWLKFCNEYHFEVSSENANNSTNTDTSAGTKQYSLKSAAIASGCCCVGFFIVAIILTILSKHFASGLFTWFCRGLLLSAVVLPICYVAYKHTNLRRVQGQYRHKFLLVHFLGILFVSTLYTAIVSIPQLTPECVLIPFNENLWLLKASMIITIILDGIVFPFVFPYCGNNYVLTYTRQNSQDVLKDAGGTYEALEAWAQKTRAEINEIISQKAFKELETKVQTTDRRSKFRKIWDIIFKE